MKKITKIWMVLALVVGLTGCGSSDDLDVVTITIGTSPDYAPYESLDLDGNVIGFDPDMVKILESYMNEGETQYSLEFVSMSFDNIVSQLQGNQIDLGISGFTYKEDRKVEWSIPYTATCQVAVVNPNSSIQSLDDLVGKVLGAQTAATGEDAANSIEDATVYTLSDMQLLFEGLNANNYDAVIVDLAVAQEYVENTGFIMLDGSLMDEENYIVAKEGNTDLIELINAALDKFIASEAYNELTDLYGLKKLDN